MNDIKNTLTVSLFKLQTQQPIAGKTLPQDRLRPLFEQSEAFTCSVCSEVCSQTEAKTETEGESVKSHDRKRE